MKTQKKLAATKRLALSAILSAIGVILMYFGSIIDLLSLTMVSVAALIVFFAVVELKGRYPYMIFGVTAFLALLLLPEKSGPLSYLMFGGFYPILKVKLERLPRPLSLLLKLVYINVMAILYYLAITVLLHIPGEETRLMELLLLVISNVAFLLLDLLMTMLMKLYYLKFRRLLGVEKFLGE